jgi:hypothetical protein
VVGVLADDRHYGPDQEHGSAIYIPMQSVPWAPEDVHFAIRMDGVAADVPRRLREAVWSVEPEIPVPLVRSMEEWASAATARTRFESLLFSAFGVVALLLAAGGLYGTLLFAVGTERRELGIRLALGARRGSVEARVLGRALRTTALGLTVGGLGVWASGRLLESRLFGIQAADPATFLGAVGLLLITAAIASWLPARRAGAVDPREMLRQD